MHSWKGIKEIEGDLEHFPKVSVVVAVRNEESNLERLLASLLAQRYPAGKYEVILVNNHSSDSSLSIMTDFANRHHHINLIDLTFSHPEEMTFKKQALTEGIRSAKGEIIITTDADCFFGPGWMQAIVKTLLSQNYRIVTGPVMIAEAENLIEHYQEIEYAGLMVATAGGIQSQYLLLANGANLAFYRSDFLALDGYRKMPDVSSGDDVFLVQKTYDKDPFSVGFIKDVAAIVYTRPVKSFWELIQQRKRWATKTSLYSHGSSRYVALLVLCNSLFLCLTLGMTFWGSSILLFLFLLQMTSKIIIDYHLIRDGLTFTGKEEKITQLLLAHLLNPILNMAVLIAAVFSRNYVWKGRITS
ncbi:MAG: glycosyltransferase [Saprospiraceae bacterium]|nr:glycosyltransferase [Saprospiraceae bacterium]